MPVRVASAGTLGIVGAPAAPKMVTVSREIDVDLTPHRSQAVTAELVAGADFVLCMELEHAMHVRGLHPTASEHQIVMLGAYGGPGTISDPIRAWTTGPFRATRDLITLCIDNWARHVLQDYEPR